MRAHRDKRYSPCFSSDHTTTWADFTDLIARRGFTISAAGSVSVGAHVGFRWPGEWWIGVVTAKTNIKKLPWKVRYGKDLYTHLFASKDRQGSEIAATGSWVLLE